MKAKRTDRNYEYSHKKNAKSLAKALDIKQRIGQNSRLHGFTASRLHGFTASRLHGFTASRLHGFTASRLHGFTASQLHSFTAEGTLCPNKTIKDRQFFSHKKRYKDFKPIGNEFNNQSHTDKYFKSITHVIKLQGTPSVELRSSSQRIIKECLIKDNLEIFAFACTAVKLKYRGGCL